MTIRKREPVAGQRGTPFHRRAALAGAIGTALAAAGLRSEPAAAKKTWPPAPPKQQPQPCTFTTDGQTMTLHNDCTATETTIVPNGVTLDGGGHTIYLSGDTQHFAHAVPDRWSVVTGVLVNEATGHVKNLTVDGTGLTGKCSYVLNGTFFSWPEGVSFLNTDGHAENVHVRNIRVTGQQCGWGMTATGTSSQTITFSDVSATGCPVGLDVVSRYGTPGVNVVFDGPNVTDCPAGIRYENAPIAATLRNATVSASDVGIRSHAVFNVDGPKLDVTDTTVTMGPEASFGLDLGGFGNGRDYPVSLTRVAVSSPPGSGVWGLVSYGNDPVVGTISDSSVSGGYVGIESHVSDLTVQNCTFDQVTTGVHPRDGSNITVKGSTFTGCTEGVASFGPGIAAVVQDNTITGTGKFPGLAAGVSFDAGAGGTVSGNTIAKYKDKQKGVTSCGILVYEDAGTVDIQNNTFPKKSNEQDICRDVPVPTASGRSARGGKAAAPAVKSESKHSAAAGSAALRRDQTAAGNAGATAATRSGDAKPSAKAGHHDRQHEHRQHDSAKHDS